MSKSLPTGWCVRIYAGSQINTIACNSASEAEDVARGETVYYSRVIIYFNARKWMQGGYVSRFRFVAQREPKVMIKKVGE